MTTDTEVLELDDNNPNWVWGLVYAMKAADSETATKLIDSLMKQVHELRAERDHYREIALCLLEADRLTKIARTYSAEGVYYPPMQEPL